MSNMKASNLPQRGALLPPHTNKKSDAGRRIHKEMSKMKVAPAMCMKTKRQ